jgi:hypothetical protein
MDEGSGGYKIDGCVVPYYRRSCLKHTIPGKTREHLVRMGIRLKHLLPTAWF